LPRDEDGIGDTPPDPIIEPPVPDDDEIVEDETPLVVPTEFDDLLFAAPGIAGFDGGAGVDTLRVPVDASDVTIVLGPDDVTLIDRRADGLGAVTLENIELIDFDTGVPAFGDALDLQQFGGQTGLEGADFETFIEMYIAYFNRAPDAIGLSFWGTAFANGTSLEEIAALFNDQPETREIYTNTASDIQFAAKVYSNVLGRAPDLDGLRFWTEALDSGAVSRDAFILEILRGAKADPSPDASSAFVAKQVSDRLYLEQKTDLGAHFAVHRGLSDTEDAALVMALFDGTEDSFQDAAQMIETLYESASDPENGAFLMPVVGILDAPSWM
jgi:hypothetical protein